MNEHLSLLSEYGKGSRYGCLVFHRNDSRRKVGEVIVETDAIFVEAIINGTLKEYKAQHLFVVPSNQFKAGDQVPTNFGKSSIRAVKKARTKASNSSPSEKKIPALSVDRLFCWFCTNCNAENLLSTSSCYLCKTSKAANSKRSLLLEIAEHSVAGNIESVDQAVCNIHGEIHHPILGCCE